uniref:NADH dehydrogenase subunit 2 n=1 Tax=Heterosiphonia pulchra TaxID=189631 RepID=UPI002E77B5FC|nr:NADH dehydrogenase subunit 2 [Heterosiphonia pulchra]WQF69565.1 NADH dehydrogenase subunit 2 [Heterosiphonia pulchra]
MVFNLTLNLYSIIVEIFFVFSCLIILLFGVIFSYEPKFGYLIINKIIYKLFLQILILGLILILIQNPIYMLSWNSFFISNSFTCYSKILVLIISILWLLFSINYILKEKLINYEYWVLILLIIVALFLIIQVNDLLSTYLTIEFQSLIFYILASFNRSSEFSTESGLKYFILGAFSSGLLLFGFSLLYSVTGLTNFNDLSLFIIQINLISDDLVYNMIFLSFCFILISFLFKLSVAPFHMWAPDVYEGAPSSVTALFGLMPKLPIIGLILKLNLIIFYNFFNLWLYLIIFCIVCSSLIGSFSAFAQIKWKRFIVFSSISHLSFFLLALICNNFESVTSLFFYLIVYLIMSISFFNFFTNLFFYKFPFYFQIRFFEQLKSLMMLNPLLGMFLGIIIFSMAGIPPLAGFFAKFFVLLNAVKNSFFILVFIILLSNGISCFYYIRLVKAIYFSTNEPKYFLVIMPFEKQSSFVLCFCIFLLVFLIFDFNFIFLCTNLLALNFFY